MLPAIKQIRGRQIYDSRGNPTVQCEVTTELGVFRAAVPSGASTGKYEALELRDGDKLRFAGKGVSQAVDNINKIIGPALKGLDCRDQSQIDRYMVEQLDGSTNQYGWCKSKLGANSILAVSLAVCRAGAAERKLPLYSYIRSLTGHAQEDIFIIPCPAFNVINGGKHGGNQLAIQQFMIMPTGATSFKEAMQIGTEVYHALSTIIQKKYGLASINVGDEGGFAPNISDQYEALDLIMQALKDSKHVGKVHIGMDCAASQFYNETQKQYDLKFKSKDHHYLTTKQLVQVYEELVDRYPIISIEDPFDQDDWQGWQMITERLGSKVQIVGDDLLVTNMSRIQQALQKNACNALLLKVNQIGTLTQAMSAALQAAKNSWRVMVSHRSGETEDTFIADLVVGLGSGQIKSGAPCRSQRMAKYNQLLRIQQELGEKAEYPNNDFVNLH